MCPLATHDAHQHKIVLSKLNYSFYSTEEGLYIYECGCWKGLLYISMKGRDLLFTYLKPLRPLIKRINDAVGWKVTYLFLAMTAGIIVAWRFFTENKKNPDKCSLLYQCSAVHSGCGSAGGDQVWMHCNLSFWMRVVFPRGKRTLSKPFLELQNQNNNVSQSPWSFIEHASHSAPPRLWNTNGLEHKNRHRLCSGEALAKYGTHAIFKSFSDSDQRRAERSWLLYFLSSHNCY